ncbi:MAG: hypothetical protein Q4Q62_07405 [Thermoplasmata archaeon]|nr:hypothetical protein [Thermoplasmata archaeon]
MNISIEDTGMFIAQAASSTQSDNGMLAETAYGIITDVYQSSSLMMMDSDLMYTCNMMFRPRRFDRREQATNGMSRIVEERMNDILWFNRHVSELTAGSWSVFRSLSKFGMEVMHNGHRNLKDDAIFARSFANQFLRDDEKEYERLSRSLDLLEDSANTTYRTHMDHLSNRLNAITGIVAMGALVIAVLSVGVSIALAFLRPTEVTRMLGIQLLPREGLTRTWHTTPT